MEDFPQEALSKKENDCDSNRDKSKEMLLFDLKDTPNNNAQRLIRNMNIHIGILEILKFHVENFLEVNDGLEDDDYKESYFEKDLDKKIIDKCYIVLAKFVANYPENQTLLIPFIETIFLKHIKFCPEIKVNLLIEQLYKDNKIILNDQGLVQKSVSSIVKAIEFNYESSSNMKVIYFLKKELIKSIFHNLF